MGLDRLVLSMLRIYCDPQMLVLVINFTPADLEFYFDQVCVGFTTAVLLSIHRRPCLVKTVSIRRATRLT